MSPTQVEGLALLPALAFFVGAVLPAWSLPHVDAVVNTLNSLGVLVAVTIGSSQAKTTYTSR